MLVLAYPNVTVPTPLVNTGLHQETLISEEDNALYMHYTVKFQCHTKIETNYTYDVRWYIDDLEITEAAHIDVPGENLSFFTMLRQHHWEQIFKPNMMVSFDHTFQLHKRVLIMFLELFTLSSH